MKSDYSISCIEDGYGWGPYKGCGKRPHVEASSPTEREREEEKLQEGRYDACVPKIDPRRGVITPRFDC
jgi:hypothetical protein